LLCLSGYNMTGLVISYHMYKYRRLSFLFILIFALDLHCYFTHHIVPDAKVDISGNYIVFQTITILVSYSIFHYHITSHNKYI